MSGRKRTKPRQVKDADLKKKKFVKLGSPTVLYIIAAIFGFIAITYWWIFHHDDIETLVPVFPKVDKAFFEVLCSKDYNLEEFKECKPTKCGRVVMDNIVSEEDARHLLMVAKKGLALGGSNGGASILDLHSGALSKDNSFINIYRLIEDHQINLLSSTDFSIYRKVKNSIHEAISREFKIPKNKLFLTKPTFFSRMNMTEAKTIHDEYWHEHVDKETYGSFHYTALLYLSTYEHDFTGGRFIFIDKNGNKTVEPRIGRVSFFTSGKENLHRVERLTSGVRYAITVAFTCDPKHSINDPTAQ